MAEVVYIACALMSILCSLMLLRHYRRSPSALLLWSCLCFVGLALNNVVLVVDMVVFPEINFGGPFLRNFLSAGAGLLLLFGLIWELT